jgi:hypothetical protein
LQLLNEIWKNVTKFTDIEEYIQVVEVFIEYVSKSFSIKEVNILLSDMLRHIKQYSKETLKKEKSEDESNSLNDQINLNTKIEKYIQNILLSVLENTKNFIDVFNMSSFLPLFDLLKTTTRVKVSKGMLSSFGRLETSESDPVIINSLFDLAKTVHDSINYRSGEKEILQISDSISSFITKITFDSQLNKELDFLCECRKSFSTLDGVKKTVVLKIVNLIEKTYKLANGKHNKKTIGFVKTCLSFCHISIPSIDDIFERLKLLLLCGQVSIKNNLLPQADVFFNYLFETLQKAPATVTIDSNIIDTEPFLVDFIRDLVSALISVPGHPDYGPLFLLKNLLKEIDEYNWLKGSDAKIKIYTNVISLLSAYYQTELPYKFGQSKLNYKK